MDRLVEVLEAQNNAYLYSIILLNVCFVRIIKCLNLL